MIPANVPACVGVPTRLPVAESIVTPVGNVPACSAYVTVPVLVKRESIDGLGVGLGRGVPCVPVCSSTGGPVKDIEGGATPIVTATKLLILPFGLAPVPATPAALTTH